MAPKTIAVFDSEAFIIDASSPSGSVGTSIINNSDTPDGTVFEYFGGFEATVTIDDTNTGADADIFNDDDTANHTVIDGDGIVANGQIVEAESTIFLRALDAFGNETGPIIEITVLSQNGVTQDVWGFLSTADFVPGTLYVKVSGDNIGDIPYADFEVCFDAATLIETADGPKMAGDIVVGEMVWTRDDGYQPIKWVGCKTVVAEGKHAPIVFAKDAIGNDQPLIVSPEHRILIRDAHIALMFGTDEALVAAKHLCGLHGVTQRQGGTVSYVHFMFDRHQIVSASGVACESFYLSENSVSAVAPAQRAELLGLFPSLGAGIASFGGLAAVALKGYEAQLLKESLAG